MIYGSVCSGIEAATVAWHHLGWKAAWFAEIEKFPSAVLAHHYPDVPNLGDMTTIAARIASSEIVAPDVLVGGTPCQAFSVAGLRGGLSDQRGQLTLSYVELANAIDTARSVRGEQPVIIVWENVPGVLSSKDNAFGCFLGALAGEDSELKPAGGRWSNAGCVFGPQRAVAWRVLDAQYFGVAQRRRRVFVVASARDGFDPTEVLFELDGVRRDSPPSRGAGKDAAAGTLRSTDGGSDVDHARAGHLVSGNGSGVAQTVSLRGREGGGTAELGGDVATCLRASTGGGDKPHVLALAVHENQRAELTLNETSGAIKCGGGKPGQGYPAVLSFSAKDHGGDAQVELAPTLRAGGHTTSHANAGVMPAVLAFDSRQDPVSSEHCFGALGSSSPQAQAVAFQSSQSGVRIGDTHATLDANNGPRRHNGALVGMSVRRLTPRECERLQGFPDDYTLIPYGKAIRPEKLDADWIKYLMRGGRMTREECARAAADGPRYKALGNSMAVPCMRWIGERIDTAVHAISL